MFSLYINNWVWPFLKKKEEVWLQSHTHHFTAISTEYERCFMHEPEGNLIQ